MSKIIKCKHVFYINENALKDTQMFTEEAFEEIYHNLKNESEDVICETDFICTTVQPKNKKTESLVIQLEIQKGASNECRPEAYVDHDEIVELSGKIKLVDGIFNNYNTFVVVLAHELGHLMYYLKYGFDIEIEGEYGEYTPHHKKKDESFSDLLSLICVGSVSKYQNGEKWFALQYFHSIKNDLMKKGYKENVIVDGKDIFKKYVYDRYGRFKKLYDLYPEKLSSVGVAA